jgi:hypothetical protein
MVLTSSIQSTEFIHRTLELIHQSPGAGEKSPLIAFRTRSGQPFEQLANVNHISCDCPLENLFEHRVIRLKETLDHILS